MRIVIGIGGGIAAYKATVLLRLFSKAGHDVVAMPTESALEFVGKPTLEALSGNPVSVSVFERVPEVNHVRQADEADAVIVAPATADLMSRLAAGRANDLLSATVLTTHAPVILAPAMHTQMWEHPATQRNVQLLKDFGYHVIEPAVGRLTGPDSGKGRLPEPDEIFDEAQLILQSLSVPQSLEGKKVVITAGGTREPLDPVRYLGNRSSGKQGIALAHMAQRMGAEVTLICGHIEVSTPQNVRVVNVSTAAELETATKDAVKNADVLIMAAAVADFRTKNYESFKIKKTDNQADAPTIELVRNPDILRNIVQLREQHPEQAPRIIVGFAAETGNESETVLELGQKKLLKKGCDFLAVNAVGENVGFGQDTNSLTILNRFSADSLTVSGSKEEVSEQLLTHIAQYFGAH